MAISLNDHEKRIKDFDSKIVDLGNRITELEVNPPSSVAIVTISKSGTNAYPIPVEHRGKKFVIMTASVSYPWLGLSENYGSISNGNKISTGARCNYHRSVYAYATLSFSISGTNIIASLDKGTSYPSSIQVLFYK